MDPGQLTQTTKDIISAAKMRQRGRYVCIANVHMVVSARRDPRLRAIMDDAYRVTSDGVPLVWALRAQGFRDAQRIAGPDLLDYVCREGAQQGLRVYFFGGSGDTIGRITEAVKSMYPGLKLVGCESPPMMAGKPPFDEHVVDRINSANADVLFVGLGCPKQEHWMAVHAPFLDAVSLGVGAAFDFLAGTKRRAPTWMQRLGLEWFFRLVAEPRRLWKRYLTTNSLFFYYGLKDFVGRYL